MWEKSACQTLTGSIAANYLRLLLTGHILLSSRPSQGQTSWESNCLIIFCLWTRDNFCCWCQKIFLTWISHILALAISRPFQGQSVFPSFEYLIEIWRACTAKMVAGIFSQMSIFCLHVSFKWGNYCSSHLHHVKLCANIEDMSLNLHYSESDYVSKSSAHLIGVDVPSGGTQSLS